MGEGKCIESVSFQRSPDAANLGLAAGRVVMQRTATPLTPVRKPRSGADSGRLSRRDERFG